MFVRQVESNFDCLDEVLDKVSVKIEHLVEFCRTNTNKHPLITNLIIRAMYQRDLVKRMVKEKVINGE